MPSPNCFSSTPCPAAYWCVFKFSGRGLASGPGSSNAGSTAVDDTTLACFRIFEMRLKLAARGSKFSGRPHRCLNALRRSSTSDQMVLIPTASTAFTPVVGESANFAEIIAGCGHWKKPHNSGFWLAQLKGCKSSVDHYSQPESSRLPESRGAMRKDLWIQWVPNQSWKLPGASVSSFVS